MASVQQLFSLEGQTALVTGGTRGMSFSKTLFYCQRLTTQLGIGQAMAIALAEAGADILLVQVPHPSPFTLHLPTTSNLP